MTQTSADLSDAGHVVTAVLVCHDGARWLPEVLEALAAQTVQPQRLVAVDTGSSDDSVALVTAAYGDDVVVATPRETSLATAVQAGLDSFGSEPVEGARTEWVWLLHDDCAPDPTALAELLARAVESPSVWLVGPKVRGWDGARLLEAGLTVDNTGHVDVGFDGIERDQGQRDDVDEVLAVSTAAALIRRDVWERLGGVDAAFAAYGDDIDLGWRVNATGGRVVVEARAVVRHVRALTTRRRRSAVVNGPTAAMRRRSGMQVVLSNCSLLMVPVLILRYLIGGLLRALGLLVISRQPSQAAAELVAIGGVLIHPQTIVSARRARSPARTVSNRELRRLFPSGIGRWRSSPFRVGWLGADRAAARVQATSSETGPVSEESESLAKGDSDLVRFARHPATVLFVVMSIVALIAERHLLSSTLHGGRLLHAPQGASDLWSTYFATWHPSSVGSVTPAPPSLAVIALLGSVLLGKVWLAVNLIMLGAVPLAAVSAFTAARPLTSAVRIRVWVAVVYSLLPAVTGAVAGGRIDVAFAAILAPQVLRASVAALRIEDGRSPWRRSVGAGLLLGLVVAFAPILWPIAFAGVVVAVVVTAIESRPRRINLTRLAAGAVLLAVPLIVLEPWTWYVITHPGLMTAGSGLPEFYSAHNPPGLSLVLLQAGGPAQPPFWIGIPLLAAALLGLTRQSRVAVARTGVALLVIGIAVAIAMTRGAGVTAGHPATRHWPGIVLLVAGAGALLTALVAAVGARPALRQQSFGWRQPAAVVVVALAVVSTVVLVGGWMVRGAGRPLTSSDPSVLPLFAQSELQIATTPRAVVLDADGRTIVYSLVRRPNGPQLGDADTAPTGSQSVAAEDHLNTAVRDLVAGKPGAGAGLAPFAISDVVVPTASAGRVASALGRSATLTIVPAMGATVWRSSLSTGELTVLDPAAARSATAGASTAPIASVLPATPGSADVTVGPGAPGRLVVLAEPTNSHWRASVDGTSLTRRTAYGWAQGFVLPAGGGHLTISFASRSRHLLLILELALVLVAIGAALPGRRPDDEDDA